MDYSKADRNSIDTGNDNISDVNDKVQDYLEQQRNRWSTEISDIFKTLNTADHKEYIDLQANALSLRQRLAEEISTYLNKISKDKTKYKKSIADRTEYYMHGFGIKTTDRQQRDMIDRDLAQRQRSLELLEVHIEFLRETKYACDQIGYAVKNRLGFMTYLQ